MPARLSVIIISRNEGKFLRHTVENLEATLPAKSQIIVVDDASTDGSADFLAQRRPCVQRLRTPGIGVARARNFGAARSTGQTLLFADAHLALPVGWCEPLLEALQDPAVGAVAPGIRGMIPRHKPGYGLRFRGPAMEVAWNVRKPRHPSPVSILPGCTLAMRRDVFEREECRWDEGLLQRGNIDNEFCMRLWLLGFQLLVVPEVMVRHRFRKRSPVQVGWPEYLHNRLRLAFVHFKDERLTRCLSALRAYPGFGEALRLVVDSDAGARRRLITSLRSKDDDWYFANFRLDW